LLKEDRTFWYIMVKDVAWKEGLFEGVLVGWEGLADWLSGGGGKAVWCWNYRAFCWVTSSARCACRDLEMLCSLFDGWSVWWCCWTCVDW